MTGLAAAGLLAALVAGVPYGLWHWLGWPLPHHLPTTTQVKDALTGPFTDRLLLNTLACLCWILWAVFLTDIARAIPDTLRNTHHSTRRATAPAGFAEADRRSGPLRGLATLLLGAIVAGLLSLRPHPALTARSAAPLRDARPSIVTAVVQLDPRFASPAVAPDVPAGAHTAVVQPPHDGIHDSLWRIAARYLGSGARWPEIYQLNQRHPQSDGGALTVPSLIRPGWVLELPQTVTHQPSASPAGGPTPPRTSPRVPTSPPATGGTTRPAPAPTTTLSTPSASPHPTTSPAPGDPSGDRSRHSGVDLGDGGYVSLALAAAISSSLVIARRRRRRWYTPGSGRRDDLPVAPVVRSLHLAHLRATAPPGDEADSSTLEVEGESASDTSDHDAGDPHPPSAGTDGAAGSVSTDSLVDLAGHGVGLVGGGADNVARAALLDLLGASGDRAVDVLVPAAELATLLGQHPDGPMPRRLHVVDTLDTALDQLEAATLHRVRQSGGDRRPIVLIARPGADTARLQAVLDNGATHNIRAILLGQWRSGTSVYVGPDGLVSAGYGAAAALNGTRLFTLPASQAVTLLNVFSEGEQNPQRQPPDAADRYADPTRVDQDAAIATELDPVSPVSSKRQPVAPIPDTQVGHALKAANLQAAPPLDLRILGPVSLMWTTAPEQHSGASAKVETIGALSPRLRELLVLLGLYPDGISRDRIADTLWPDAPPERPHNNLTTSLSRLRTGLGKATRGQVSEVVLAVGDQLRLDPAVIRVDYRDFTDADTARRDAATDAARAEAWRHMITTYRGELADGLSAEWLETPREAIRRDAIDAASRLARAVVATDPQQTLDLLETARARDPYNEQLYRDIMRVQRRLGQVDAIERTLALLATRLGELDESPSRETVELASALRRPATREPGGTATPVAR
ncbi:BTAD domain-containing putative transcriptional regulator [Jatrophihabitans lederbergiae]|uniref:BTAD domain-containing putative transcriptional regulator n=1 Tax=Jatrophihabitans lederbergiae TaxID=3075547 RepID=A0ABU2JGB6_9ACTN|nr:BTAD domain-containing putative transcriptional regulator [Jatrophihabitans sp. DSM 44399]MDT0263773.1 BTAD domain-containing putative transcriptional regulator [Jatrophihabitans sp. DSM 44399]